MSDALRRRGLFSPSAAIILITPLAIWFIASLNVPPANPAALPTRTLSAPAPILPTPVAPNVVELLKSDPMSVIRMGREKYDREVHDYRAVLLKQEFLPDGMTPVQEIEVRYRSAPRTTYMLWRANASGARRALYIPGDARFVDSSGQPVARVEPNGTLVRLITTDVFVPIHGPDAKKASRRTIDECGFAASFALLEKFNGVAEARGVLDLKYGGEGEVDGRPTYTIVRNLPYTGPDCPYPDARMVLHLDQEWLLPVAIYSYADTGQKQLLGSYVFTKVELNPGFGDDAFAF